MSQEASPVTVGNPQRTPNILNIYLMQRNDTVERIHFCSGNVLSKKRKEKSDGEERMFPTLIMTWKDTELLSSVRRFLFLSVFFSDKMYPCMSPLGFRRLSFFCQHVIPFFQHVTAIRILGPVPITLLPIKIIRCSKFAK